MQRDAADLSAGRAGRFEGRAKRHALRLIRKIGAAALLLGIGMWSFIAWSLWSDYSAAMAIGRTQGRNLAAVFAFELTSGLDAANAALRRLADQMTAVANGTANAGAALELRQAVAATIGSEARLLVAAADGRIAFSMFPTDTRSVMDAGGADARGKDAGKADVGDQSHFIAHRDDPSGGLTIDPYVGGNTAGLIEVSMRLAATGGNFAGEAILLLKPGNLTTLNRQLDLGHRGMIVIADGSGIVRAGFDRDHEAGQVGVGTDLRGEPYPADLQPGETASISRIDRIVHIERQIAIRRLDRYDLRVLAALDLDDVLGTARSHVLAIGLIGVAATGLIAVLALLLAREVWRRTKREVELALDRDRLRIAQAQIAADRARLAETNSALLASKDSAEAANRARSQFLAHMSHELRTPLHAIIGFSELIQDQAPTQPGSPPLGSYAADILGSGRHLLELINSILDISKVESGTATLTESIFVVADLVRTSLVSVRAQAKARNIAIALDLPEVTLRLRADRTRLLQILINLLSNAVKFTPDNGRIVVSVAVVDTSTALAPIPRTGDVLEVEAIGEVGMIEQPGTIENPEPMVGGGTGELVFSIADTGIGMTEPEIAIALEPFGQVDNTLARPFEGTGLGLPLARKLTELHGGKLEVTSIKGHGTTAKVILPADRLVQRDEPRAGGA